MRVEPAAHTELTQLKSGWKKPSTLTRHFSRICFPLNFVARVLWSLSFEERRSGVESGNFSMS